MGHHAAYLQIPIGLESECAGLVDLIRRKAVYFEGSNGETIIEKDIPDNLKEVAEEKRKELIGRLFAFFLLLSMIRECRVVSRDVL